ncbi:Predicted O-linked N-acetylglucosamine transferase, SPINDLY family [Rhizobiales bacterium GAS113]|jgi:predicted O-linked N-acetylglucosamine transferase (SPINDLY family)|nr:Predicted O-linked N-acetylglucosamine transferase, SPINDLY family [Rhizobiales bacterium GAS113]
MHNHPGELEIASKIYAESIKQAFLRQSSIAELFSSAARLAALQQKQLVADLYKAWIAYNADDRLIYAVYFNYGTALADAGDRPGAMNALRECIRLKPDFYPPYINLGRILEDSGQIGPAVAQWLDLINHASAVNGDSVSHKCNALIQMGRVLESIHNDTAAEDALKQCLDINPTQIEVIQHWIALRQRQCKWPVITEWERVKRENLAAGISPLSLANLSDDPMLQLARAHHYNKQSIGMPKGGRRPYAHLPAARHETRRLRIGYVSSDLREHAVGFAMTDVMELHDREHFEVFAYYCGIERTDSTQERIKAGVDHWVDIIGLGDEQAAARIAEDKIDILVDLNGYTKFARTKVFALRPAPIAVNWFGFPGTMGSPYHHYIVADPHIIPQELEIYYSEKVLRLPCYQPNDRKRVVASRRPSRQDEKLPENAFVYCCLNGMQKLTALTFGRWMTILKAVPDSVLWLLSGTTDTNERVRQIATQHGVAPERLIFAEKRANPEHLARYALADLFLDNLPYGAHTTAADAMWMGVPILTLTGRSFASRVCSSLVRAAGIAEMVCATPDAYVARAIELGRDRKSLAAIKDKLVAGRDSCLLFDTPLVVRGLEDLYRQMWADFQGGRLPVPDLSNLEIYNEIGLELDLENTELLSDDAYRALYRDRLADRHSIYPIRPDGRLWQTTS